MIWCRFCGYENLNDKAVRKTLALLPLLSDKLIKIN